MAYIGRQLARGENKLFDDISSSFNGSTTTFNLTVSSVATATATPYQLFVSLGGVMQKPNTDFTTAGNQITFTTAPAAGLSCWIMMQGDTIDQAAIPDSSVTPSKISGSNFAFSGDLRLKDADGSHYVGFASPTTVTTNKVWTLPAADGGASTFLQTNGSGVLSWSGVGGASGIDFNDNVKARWGTGNDLEIYHDGTDSYIKNNAGDLILRDDSIKLKAYSTTDTFLEAINGGAVSIRYDNSIKLATTSTGVSITGALTVSTNATITGDLTVSGTTTTINTQTLDVEDKNVVIGKVSSPSDTTADGGGWTLKGASDKTFNWVNATDAWTSSEHIHLIDNKKLLVGGASGTVDGLEIVHNGSNSILNDSGTGTLQLQLGGSTKLEVTSGGINVTGAITVGGAALASGNTFTAVADGAIANNKAVYLATDGKVGEISATQVRNTSPSISGSVSTAGVYITGTNEMTQDAKCIWIGNNKVLIAWMVDNWPSNGKMGIKGSVGTWQSAGYYDSFGTVFEMHDDTRPRQWDVCWDETNDTIIISYCDSQDSDKGKSKFIKRSGTTLSYISSGTNPVTWRNSASTDSVRCYWDNSIQRTVLCYESSSGQGFSMVGAKNSSDDSYTYGSPIQATGQTGIYDRFVALCGLTSGKVAYFSNQTDGKFYYNVGVINTSNNTVSWGTQTEAKSDEQMYCDCAYNSDKGIVAFVGRHTGGSNNSYVHMAAFDNSNNTIGSWTGVQMEGNGNESNAMCYDTDSDAFHIFYQRGSSPNNYRHRSIYHGTSGNASSYSITNAVDVLGTNSSGDYSSMSRMTASPGLGVVSGAARANSNSNRLSMNNISTTTLQSSLTHARKFVGFADQAYTNGQTATIKTYGNTVDTLSGLTIGSIYYVQHDGTVGSSWDSTYFSGFSSNTPAAGLAIAADTLLIKDPLQGQIA